MIIDIWQWRGLWQNYLSIACKARQLKNCRTVIPVIYQYNYNVRSILVWTQILENRYDINVAILLQGWNNTIKGLKDELMVCSVSITTVHIHDGVDASNLLSTLKQTTQQQRSPGGVIPHLRAKRNRIPALFNIFNGSEWSWMGVY